MAFNSDYFDLDNWKITLPVDSSGKTSGTAVEVKELEGYEHSSYFWDAPDGAMVFRAMVEGATTSGSKYARTELREMNGSDRAAWNLKTGGTLSATLKIDETPTKSDGTPGRIVVGQIHGENDELVRLYYENGKVYFMNDQAGSDNKELKFTFKSSDGKEPSISLGEKFSYMIDARGDTLVVDIFADGQLYRSSTKINSVWQSDSFYFKAGVYLGVNEDTGSGDGQVSFYGLDFGHTEGSGRGGWQADTTTPPPVEEPLPNPEEPDPTPEEPNPAPGEVINGNDSDNQLNGSDADEILNGRDGNDVLNGGGGDDEIWGNAGDDVLIGGQGADTLKGGPGRDTFKFNNLNEAGDIILDFHGNYDRIDVSALLGNAPGFKNGSAFEDGFIQRVQNGEDVDIYIDMDGSSGSAQKKLLFTLKDDSADNVQEDYFLLPEDTKPTEPDEPPAEEPPVDEEPPAPEEPPVDEEPPASEEPPVEEPPVEEPPAEDRPFKDTSKSLKISGDEGDNQLFGGRGKDTIKGRDGDDSLYGGDGKDYIQGNDGDDVLVGGHGKDTLKGGYGTDTYVYEDVRDFGDKITEFREGEKIDISALKEDFVGGEDMDASELMDAGYLSFTRTSSTKAKLYADMDGESGDGDAILVAELSTAKGQDLDSSVFIL